MTTALANVHLARLNYVTTQKYKHATWQEAKSEEGTGEDVSMVQVKTMTATEPSQALASKPLNTRYMSTADIIYTITGDGSSSKTYLSLQKDQCPMSL